MLRDRINIINEGDLFVGVKFVDGVPTISFPHGYSVSNDENELRNDIIVLLSTIRKYADSEAGSSFHNGLESQSLPIESYLYIISDFLKNSYYVEKEQYIKSDTKGKILWKRTISKEKPYIDGDNVVYLNFQTKANKNNENNLITKIHKICVYESFSIFGWMYFENSFMPQKPNCSFDKNEAISTLNDYLNKTFNDEKKKLFRSMINIIRNLKDDYGGSDFYYGVDKFDSIWEKMVDDSFGEKNKEKYFPHANWYIIKDEKNIKTSALMPDTIMKYNGMVFVLDAKYYRYGIDETNPHLLPQTDSIQKQITYGKHISKNIQKLEKGAKHIPGENEIYNAFIMPFETKDHEVYKFVSIATSDWEKYDSDTKNYSYVVGILLDTKYLMTRCNEDGIKAKMALSSLIIESLEANKKMLFD